MEMAETAQESLSSMTFGSHWLLKLKLAEYGIITSTREDAIKKARQLCDEFIAQIGALKAE